MKTSGIFLMIGIAGVLILVIVLAFMHDKARMTRELNHSKQQAQECREMGGFARTHFTGTLIECSFPRK